jgi:hypothetical protein
MSKILLGSDPELFFVRDRKFVSAVGRCKGTKQEPFEFQKGFSIHNDNVAVEFNVPPASNVEEWTANHHTALKYCRDVAKEQGCNLKIVSDAVFPDEELDSPEAKEFGCNPDYSAWNLTDNETPSAETNLRTAGGHIHIGCDLSFREKIQVVRLLDVFVGVPLMMLEPNSRRSQLYGDVGCMRDKDYGVEYRTPSNYWLRTTGMIKDVFNMTMAVVQHRANLVNVLEMVEGNVGMLKDKAAFQRVLHTGVHGYEMGLYSRGLHSHVLQGV